MKSLGLSVPTASLDFWDKRLAKFEYPHHREERFGERRIHFAHPCGIEYDLIGCDTDTRKPWTTEETPEAVAIRGVHGITVSVRELAEPERFTEVAWNGQKTAQHGAYVRYEMGKGGPGTIIEYAEEPNVPRQLDIRSKARYITVRSASTRVKSNLRYVTMSKALATPIFLK